MTGVERIAAERQRQIDAEGYTTRHDMEEHAAGQLAAAACCYACPPDWPSYPGVLDGLWPDYWEFKPTPGDRIRELEKAGALIAAEIDRLLAGG